MVGVHAPIWFSCYLVVLAAVSSNRIRLEVLLSIEESEGIERGTMTLSLQQ